MIANLPDEVARYALTSVCVCVEAFLPAARGSCCSNRTRAVTMLLPMSRHSQPYTFSSWFRLVEPALPWVRSLFTTPPAYFHPLAVPFSSMPLLSCVQDVR